MNHLFAFSHAHWELESLRKTEGLSVWAVVTKCPEAVRPWTVELISLSYSKDREVHITQPQIWCLVRAPFLTQRWCLHNMSSRRRKGKAAFGGWALFHKDINPVRKMLPQKRKKRKMLPRDQTIYPTKASSLHTVTFRSKVSISQCGWEAENPRAL